MIESGVFNIDSLQTSEQEISWVSKSDLAFSYVIGANVIWVSDIDAYVIDLICHINTIDIKRLSVSKPKDSDSVSRCFKTIKGVFNFLLPLKLKKITVFFTAEESIENARRIER